MYIQFLSVVVLLLPQHTFGNIHHPSYLHILSTRLVTFLEFIYVCIHVWYSLSYSVYFKLILPLVFPFSSMSSSFTSCIFQLISIILFVLNSLECHHWSSEFSTSYCKELYPFPFSYSLQSMVYFLKYWLYYLSDVNRLFKINLVVDIAHDKAGENMTTYYGPEARVKIIITLNLQIMSLEVLVNVFL
jgi:hypothetical protein